MRLNVEDILILAVLVGLTACSSGCDPGKQLVTERLDKLELVFGHEVANPYGWLEDLESDQVWEWANEQDRLSQNALSVLQEQSGNLTPGPI